MMDFIVNNYLLIIIIAGFLIFALIGFIVDSSKNKKAKEAEILTETISPEELNQIRPAGNVTLLQQGSNFNIFILRVTPNGNVSISKYRSRTADGIDFGLNHWINIACTFMTNN